MKICILTPRYPFPENGGDVLRINGIARYLKSKGHQLILVSYINKNNVVSESDYVLYDTIKTVKFSRIISLINSMLFFVRGKTIQCGYYYSFRYRKAFSNIIKEQKPDLYISHLVRMEAYLRKYHLEKQSIIEMTDALSKTYGLSSKSKHFSLKKIIYTLERKPIIKLEKSIIKTYPKVVLVSENDINYLGNEKSLAYHTNGINIYQNYSQYNENKICFVGNMRTIQNQDAVISFIDNIFPLIKKVRTNAEFHIVGAEPSPAILKLENKKDIYVTGFVDSIEEYIKDSCMIVAPVNIAAGIQNKVLIGMACRIPVVITSLIAAPLKELQNGIDCLIEDNCDKFANACITLMDDKELREKIASNGQNFVEKKYAWDEKLNGYEILDE